MCTVARRPSVAKLFQSLEDHFKKEKHYFDLFVNYSFKSEDWIKTEIVSFWHQRFNVSFAGISQEVHRDKEKPDLSINNNTKPVTIELKVLPIGRNYSSAIQHFKASENNKRDFRRLNRGERDFLIYVFWNDMNQWERLKKYLRTDYENVTLKDEFNFDIEDGNVVFSLWGKSKRTHKQ